MRLAVILVFVEMGITQEPAQISDKTKLEIALKQRDLLVSNAVMKDAAERYEAAKARAEQQQKELADLFEAAKKTCGARQFNPEKLACVDTPVAARGKTERR